MTLDHEAQRRMERETVCYDRWTCGEHVHECVRPVGHKGKHTTNEIVRGHVLPPSWPSVDEMGELDPASPYYDPALADAHRAEHIARRPRPPCFCGKPSEAILVYRYEDGREQTRSRPLCRHHYWTALDVWERIEKRDKRGITVLVVATEPSTPPARPDTGKVQEY